MEKKNKTIDTMTKDQTSLDVTDIAQTTTEFNITQEDDSEIKPKQFKDSEDWQNYMDGKYDVAYDPIING